MPLQKSKHAWNWHPTSLQIITAVETSPVADTKCTSWLSFIQARLKCSKFGMKAIDKSAWSLLCLSTVAFNRYSWSASPSSNRGWNPTRNWCSCSRGLSWDTLFWWPRSVSQCKSIYINRFMLLCANHGILFLRLRRRRGWDLSTSTKYADFENKCWEVTHHSVTLTYKVAIQTIAWGLQVNG